MRVKDYSALKAASKVVFVKATLNSGESDEREAIQLTEKRFNASTGEALSDSIHEVYLHSYESEKTSLEEEKAKIEVDIEELGKIITDIKAL